MRTATGEILCDHEDFFFFFFFFFSLADLIHNFGDALTAIPLGLAFFFRRERGERWAGVAVVATIFVSALVALVQTILRFIHPHTPHPPLVARGSRCDRLRG